MTRIAFTADLHVDDFGSKVDAATGVNARFVDGLDMAAWIAQDARERGCDVLVVGGDLTENRHAAAWRVALIGEALAQFGGPIVIARGNHDGLRGGRSIADDLGARDGWHGFSRPGVVRIGETAIAVLPYLDRHWMRAQPGFDAVPEAELLQLLGEQFLAIARGLYAEASQLSEDAVLVVHQGLGGGFMSDKQQAFLGDQSLVIDTAALAAIGFGAVLAGHFHLHQVLSTDPLVIYSGSPYRTDFGEEHQAKGYLVVDTNEVPTVGFDFIETPARRFVTLTDEQIEDLVGEDQVEGAVVRVVGLPRHLDPQHVRAMLEALGAFEVASITHAPAEAAAPSGGLSEALTPEAALDEYFAGDDDRDALVDRGRGVLAEVA